MIKEQLIDEEANVLKKLKNGDENTLKSIYQSHEGAFIRWAQHHFQVDDIEAKDVFQLAIIALYQNVKKGTLQILTSSLKTYIFSIGRKLLLKLHRNKKKTEARFMDIDNLDITEEVYVNLVDNQKLNTLVERIGEPCSSILQKFYFHGLTMEELARETGYKTEAVVRKKKHECMQKIKKLVSKNNLRIEDFLRS